MHGQYDNRCLSPAKVTEFSFLFSCSVPDRLNVLSATIVDVLDAVQSIPQNRECPLLEDAEVSLSALSRKSYRSSTDNACMLLTQ